MPQVNQISWNLLVLKFFLVFFMVSMFFLFYNHHLSFKNLSSLFFFNFKNLI